tara:strand:- start:1195 stop:1473 length:279 start_codon:yes stop_codon:yes gene_type:complete
MIWDMIENMASDRLWIYTGIMGSVFGALFLAYMRDTKIGLWLYSKWDILLDTIRDKFGWTWFDQPDDAWRSLSPKIAKKIDELETRIKRLEK